MKILTFISLILSMSFAQDQLRDDFDHLKNWKPLTFKKIEKHTLYSIVNDSPEESVLMAESEGSASGIIWKETFNVNESPDLRWRWKISNVYTKGNAKEKSGDDYPIRIYVMFEYDPETAGFWESALYESVKLIYGEYPPHSSLNYIWANKNFEEDIIPNPFTDKAQMILLEHGTRYVGEWRNESVNILEDYRRAFGESPPKRASLAIMSDSDNTGQSAQAWIDFIELTSQ